jgi:phage major head subunit gpT-like protein
MDINRANMSSLFTGFNKAYSDAFLVKSKEYETKLAQFVMEVPGTTGIEEFPFLEQLAGLREWIGPRQIKNVASRKLTVKARTFEDTFSLPVNDIADDKYGLYTPLAAQMGANAANLKADIAFEALVGNGKWLDGANFFGTSRKYGKNTIGNYTTNALSESTFNSAYLAMAEYQGHGNTSLRVRPTHLVVGPKLRTTAWAILKDEFRYDGSDKVQVMNPNQNLVELVILPELVGTYDDYWFLVAAGDMVKPLVLVNREEPKFVAKDKVDDDNVFFGDNVIYGTKARAEAALAVPHLVYAGYVA